jgi:DNA mismatch repair protein MutS
MTNVSDLHIQQEILPLFDFTLNDFSKTKLIDLLSETLSSTEEILVRQNILKGFIKNLAIFENYSYSRVDLFEVYTFLANYYDLDTQRKGFKLRLLLSEKERHQTRSKYIQLTLLLHKLQINYIKRMDIKVFPEIYKKELQSINDFFSAFNLPSYEELIREQRFKIRHIIELTKVISAKANNGEFVVFWRRYFLFEAYLSISMGITKHCFSFPIFTKSVLSFEELYHPLLKHPVKNTFILSNNVILITGPNMSGKSTFLKSIGLSVYLGHLGLGVAASKSEMPFFYSISTSINLSDDILSGHSHFMSEVMNLKKVVIDAAYDKKCFAVFDELFRGTNIEDAVEISSTTIKGLTQFKNSIFFISTHLHQLKEIEEVQSQAISTYYFDCGLVDNSPIFNYQLKKGWSDLKIGQILFEKEGLNKLLNKPH